MYTNIYLQFSGSNDNTLCLISVVLLLYYANRGISNHVSLQRTHSDNTTTACKVHKVSNAQKIVFYKISYDNSKMH